VDVLDRAVRPRPREGGVVPTRPLAQSPVETPYHVRPYGVDERKASVPTAGSLGLWGRLESVEVDVFLQQDVLLVGDLAFLADELFVLRLWGEVPDEYAPD